MCTRYRSVASFCSSSDCDVGVWFHCRQHYSTTIHSINAVQSHADISQRRFPIFVTELIQSTENRVKCSCHACVYVCLCQPLFEQRALQYAFKVYSNGCSIWFSINTKPHFPKRATLYMIHSYK